MPTTNKAQIQQNCKAGNLELAVTHARENLQACLNLIGSLRNIGADGGEWSDKALASARGELELLAEIYARVFAEYEEVCKAIVDAEPDEAVTGKWELKAISA